MNTLKNSIRGNYTTVPNSLLSDDRITWKAKGIFAYLLSKPDNWNFYIDEIKGNATDGKTALKSGLRELEEYCYLRRSPSNNASDGKFAGWEWVLMIPTPVSPISQRTGNPTDGKTNGRESRGYSNKENSKPDNTNTDLPTAGAENAQLTITSGGVPDDPGAEAEYYIPEKADVVTYFTERDEMIPKDIPLEAEKFINHYEEREWKNSSKKRIKFWRRQAANWCNRYKQFQESRIKKYHDEKNKERNTIGHAEQLSKKFDNAWGD